MPRLTLLHRDLRPGDVDGKKAAVRGEAVVFRPVAVEHKVPGAEDGAIAFVKLAVQDHKQAPSSSSRKGSFHPM